MPRLVYSIFGTFLCALPAFALAADPVAPVSDGPPLPQHLDCVIQPSEVVDVGTAVPGVIEAIHFHRGQSVKKGSVLAAIRSDVDRAALKVAKARAAQKTPTEIREQSAQLGAVTEKRNRILASKNLVSKQAMDEVAAEKRIAELQVEQERENRRIAELEARRLNEVLRQREIRSPVEGVVMERLKSVGEYIEDQGIVRVAQLDPLHIEVIVPVDHLGQVVPGMTARVTALVPGAQAQVATVEHVDRIADAASGTFGAQLTLPNPGHKVPAGLRCDLEFQPFNAAEATQNLEDLAAHGKSLSDRLNKSAPKNSQPTKPVKPAGPAGKSAAPTKTAPVWKEETPAGKNLQTARAGDAKNRAQKRQSAPQRQQMDMVGELLLSHVAPGVLMRTSAPMTMSAPPKASRTDRKQKQTAAVKKPVAQKSVAKKKTAAKPSAKKTNKGKPVAAPMQGELLLAESGRPCCYSLVEVSNPVLARQLQQALASRPPGTYRRPSTAGGYFILTVQDSISAGRRPAL